MPLYHTSLVLPADGRMKQIENFPENRHIFGHKYGMLVAGMFLTILHVCLEGSIGQPDILVDIRFASSPSKN